MAHTSGNTMMKWLVAALVIAFLGGEVAQAVVICNINTDNLGVCRAAVTGNRPPPPNKQCCALVRGANIPCLCTYKSALPALGINPANALALPVRIVIKVFDVQQCKVTIAQ
ncbi:hypothetical protein Ahy_A07g031231 [Arachis hypogaea]|uniref:Bifunctional inhibitor/plant lipid transfer protein/seed storage helical domain-containing protein n=1 Tax=Arachis hypogaea TaxID=3818 RepID=A0A445C382_ARAHY|nr:hypothetical protein Ahy_A07g031231 [Arachis hypogaea]